MGMADWRTKLEAQIRADFNSPASLAQERALASVAVASALRALAEHVEARGNVSALRFRWDGQTIDHEIEYAPEPGGGRE